MIGMDDLKIKDAVFSEKERLLKIRKKQKIKKPDFEKYGHKHKKRVTSAWRRPRGSQGKHRIMRKGKPPLVKSGYGSPSLVKGLHPSGYEEVIVYNVTELNFINPDAQVVRIGRSVGRKKRLDIEEKAKSLNIHIVNTVKEV